MGTNQQINYDRIAKAIEFIQSNFKEQPSLKEVATYVHLSPYHFQRMFTEWAGTSPKKFLQYINIQYAKRILVENNDEPLLNTAIETGLSSTSRLHDLFINVEGMTPAEYKSGGLNLHINYSFAESPFGDLIIASTQKGVCYMAFEEPEEKALEGLVQKFPKANLQRKLDLNQQKALFLFQHDWSKLSEIKLHLKGTPFQLKVWESLLNIPLGRLSTYGAIAKRIGNPKASRAVGTAIGNNPVAFLIPCHRVIQSSGLIGGYRWGTTRKVAIIGWEGARVNN